MQAYISAALAIAAISLLSLLLFPSGQEKTKKSFEFALAVLALAILSRPLAELRLPSFSVGELTPPSLEEMIGEAEKETLSEMERAIAAGISIDIAEKFSLPEGAVRTEAHLSLESGELSVAELKISLSFTALAADPIKIRDYARKTYTENCEVTTDAP